jgi:hypothetical protein
MLSSFLFVIQIFPFTRSLKILSLAEYSNAPTFKLSLVKFGSARAIFDAGSISVSPCGTQYFGLNIDFDFVHRAIRSQITCDNGFNYTTMMKCTADERVCRQFPYFLTVSILKIFVYDRAVLRVRGVPTQRRRLQMSRVSPLPRRLSFFS